MRKVLFAGNNRAGLECLEELLRDPEFSVVDVRTKTPEIKAATDKNYVGADYDTIFSVFYHKLISKEDLKWANLAINFHGGPLPEYGGRFSNVWAIFNGEKEHAVTAHHMEAAYDEGPIFDQIRFPITDDETGKSLYEKITDNTVELFKRTLDNIKREQYFSVPQTGTRRFYKTLPNNGVIDLGWEENKIERFIRAMYFPPHTPAQLQLNENTYNVVIKE